MKLYPSQAVQATNMPCLAIVEILTNKFIHVVTWLTLIITML